LASSTGGIIALDLALMNDDMPEDMHIDASKDVQRVTSNFEAFCKDSFAHTNILSGIPFISKPRYHTSPMEEALEKTYPHACLFGWSHRRATLQSKVAVMCSLSTGQSIVVSNYNRSDAEDGMHFTPFVNESISYPLSHLLIIIAQGHINSNALSKPQMS
jgi:hypothetical protein